MYPIRSSMFALACVLALTTGCDEKQQAPAAAPPAATAPAAAAPAAPAAAIPDADKKEAADIFGSRCTPCHGPQGAGDGAASAGLVPAPRNLQDAAWQASATDEHIEKIIVGGGLAVGKAATMPPNPDLGGKPAIVQALRSHIRGLKK